MASLAAAAQRCQGQRGQRPGWGAPGRMAGQARTPDLAHKTPPHRPHPGAPPRIPTPSHSRFSVSFCQVQSLVTRCPFHHLPSGPSRHTHRPSSRWWVRHCSAVAAGNSTSPLPSGCRHPPSCVWGSWPASEWLPRPGFTLTFCSCFPAQTSAGATLSRFMAVPPSLSQLLWDMGQDVVSTCPSEFSLGTWASATNLC